MFAVNKRELKKKKTYYYMNKTTAIITM